MKKITEITIEDLMTVFPADVFDKHLEYLCGKREVKHFHKWMIGQTMQALPGQGGYYLTDVLSFLRFRRKGLKGKDMPLLD